MGSRLAQTKKSTTRAFYWLSHPVSGCLATFNRVDTLYEPSSHCRIAAVWRHSLAGQVEEVKLHSHSIPHGPVQATRGWPLGSRPASAVTKLLEGR
jgi:hypothetical protein